MTALADSSRQSIRDERFFLLLALIMAAVLVAGFVLQLAMGRSSFGAPPIVHLHAVVFFGWVVIFVLQSALAGSGSMRLHRRLGWLATGWSVAMVAVGIALMLHVVRAGTVPFFFQPQYFLVANVLTLLGFAAATWAAVAMRRRSDWHCRLHFIGMAFLIGPAFGRLLPMPLLVPWSYQIAFGFGLVFLLVGLTGDVRRTGRGHRAWTVGVAAMGATIVAAQVIGLGPVGTAIYRSVTVGSPGAAVAPLAFAQPPSDGQVTGR